MADALKNSAAARDQGLRLRCRAVRDLHRLPGRVGGWCASGDDAQFELHRFLGLRLRSGIYRIELDIRLLREHLQGPALYPAYRGRYSELTRIELPPPDARGRIVATIRLTAGITRLRFDPSCAPCEFELGPVTIVRLHDLERAGIGLAWHQFRVHAREHGIMDALRHAREVVTSQGWLRSLRRDVATADPVAAAQLAYPSWVERFDQIALDEKDIARRLEEMPKHPLFSVLLPVYNTPAELLRRCIDSVRRQFYPHWELCIADDCSTEPAVAQILLQYAQLDARIRLVRRDRNGHIARATMSALELARGEFVALLDHDDELAGHALLLMAESICAQSGAALLYSDEDKLDSQGQRCEPYFKPDWNIELLRGQNYVNHLLVLRTDLVREVGGFRPGFEGSQDYDLLLRYSERIQPWQVVHVPHVLYHWRATLGSTALAGSEKGYAAEAGLRALQDHLRRMQIDGTAEMATAGHYRVRYRLPQQVPSVCLIIPTRDRVDLLSRCLDTLLRITRYANYEVLVIDNGSREAATLRYFERVVADPRVRVLSHDIPFNYAALNNLGAANTTADFIGLLNNDLEIIQADWLEEMVVQAIQPGVGAVGAMLYYPDDRIQHAGVVVGLGGVAGHSYKGCARGYGGQMNRARLVQSLDAVTAACMLVRRNAYLDVGGLDNALTVAFNDTDLCLKLRTAGYRIVWTPFAELYHWESASRGYEDSPAKQARFAAEIEFMQRRWGARLHRDSAYNPNLSLRGDAFTLAWPPREAAYGNTAGTRGES